MSCNSYKLFIFTLFFSSSILGLIMSSPIPNPSPYDNFIKFLSDNNCSMPKEIEPPFPNSSDPSSFNYLSTPLKECRSSILDDETTKKLCTEVFDVLKNITCEKYNESLPLIVNQHLSENVCRDFESLKDVIPKRDDYWSGRLSDKFICDFLCSAEKHESLCTTLLWSYNNLLQIRRILPIEAFIQGNTIQDNAALSVKDALPNEAQIQENNSKDTNKVSSDKVAPAEKSSSLNVEQELNSQNVKKADKVKVEDTLHPEDKTLPASNSNQTDEETHSSKVSDDLGPNTSQDNLNKKIPINPQGLDGVVNPTASSTKNVPPTTLKNKSPPENQKSTQEASENNIEPIESKNLSSPSSQSEHLDDTENKVDVDEKLSKKVLNKKTPEASSKEKSLSTVIEMKDNIKNKTVNNLLNNGNDKEDKNNVGSNTREKSAEQPIAPSIENNDNEVKSNFPEEEKSKAKQADVETEKQKQSDYEAPNEVPPDNDLKQPESSTQLVLPDEDTEHQDDKDTDQYNDIENEGDYPKAEYDGSFPVKNKEPVVKSPIPASSNQLPSGFESSINGRNFGHISEEIAMIGTYPEPEDSHFFFYFLSIVLIIMAGYLIFHNKQKIIALIVEGRHERRRRSHGAGYKKLETK